MVIADYYHPDWGCLVDFFTIQVKELLAQLEVEPIVEIETQARHTFDPQ